MAGKGQVDGFLAITKQAIGAGGFVFKNRPENIAFMTEQGIAIETIKSIIGSLTAKNYCKGPLEDKSGGMLHDVWIFGIKINKVEAYVKLAIGGDLAKVVCISFHKAQLPMSYPFGGSNENN